MSSAVEPLDLRAILNEEHRRLDDLFGDLLSAFHADAREATSRLWCELEQRLDAHLLLEESHIFPALQAVDPDEVQALATDHEHIRTMMAQLGPCLDLHMVRDATARSLVTLLRAHARREDGLVYRWVEAGMPQPQRDELRARLRALEQDRAAVLRMVP